MTTKPVKAQKAGQFNRSGNVHYRVDTSDSGSSLVELSVDYERAPIPDHTYVADFFDVSQVESEVLILFGKLNTPSATSLRNKVEIYFPAETFVHQLWNTSRRLHEIVAARVKELGRTAKDCSAVSVETDKVQTLTANNALVVLAGGQCMIDFFLISAKDLWIKTSKGDPLGLDALVRVYMNEPLLLGFLNRCDSVAKDLIANLNLALPEGNNENMEPIEL